MFPFPAGRTLLAAGLFALIVVAPATAADVEILLASKPLVAPATEPPADTLIPNPNLRPNGKESFYLFVKNTGAEPKDWTVEVHAPDGAVLARSALIKVLDKATAPVKLEAFKAEAKDAPPKDAEPAKKDPPPKADPPLPGVSLTAAKLGTAAGLRFGFVVKVFEGTKVIETKTIPIDILRPSAYVSPTANLIGAERRGVEVDVVAKPYEGPPRGKADPDRKEPDKKDLAAKRLSYDPPVDVTLKFPPQLGLKVAELREGSYQRNLSQYGQEVKLLSKNLPVTRRTENVKFHLNVDGFARAFTYTLKPDLRFDPKEDSDNTILPDDVNQPVIRLFPVSPSPKAQALAAQVTTGSGVGNQPVLRYPTLPSKDLRFRVEVNNEPVSATLELRIDRNGTNTFTDPDEKIDLGLPRDYKVYLDAAGKDGSLTAANTVGDLVTGVDVSALRGTHALRAILRVPNTAAADYPAAEISLVVDETPPPGDDMAFGNFPRRHTKGVPLPVYVSADDPESKIDRVFMFVGQPGPDGKIPEDAVKFEATRVRFTSTWVAEVQLPPPAPVDPKAPPAPKAPVVVTAVAENGVGLMTPKVVRIELVDPQGGTIAVTVRRGERPQAGVEVSLRDNEGKEKGALKTNAKGVATFVNLPPGPYRLYAGKPDASTGLIGKTLATIPDPPDTKPIPVDLDLAKRR